MIKEIQVHVRVGVAICDKGNSGTHMTKVAKWKSSSKNHQSYTMIKEIQVHCVEQNGVRAYR